MGGGGGKNSGGTNFGPFKGLGFQQLSYLSYFGLGVKIHKITLKRSMVTSADIFAVLMRHFQSSTGNLIIYQNNATYYGSAGSRTKTPRT